MASRKSAEPDPTPEDLEFRWRRAQRAKEIRKKRKLTGEKMAEALLAVAAQLEISNAVASYDKSKVSRVESDGRITAEDGVLWAALDPEGRGVAWFTIGRDLPEIVGVEVAERSSTKTRKQGNHR